MANAGKKNEVAKPQTTAVAVVPEYMRQGTSRGSENVGTEDVVIPRIEIAQALSGCMKPNDPEYIDGCRLGDLYNSVTREVYGQTVNVIPVYFRKQWLIWKDRKQGGGFRGAYDTPQEAEARIAGEEDKEHLEAVETGQQLVLVERSDGKWDEAIVSMARTKLKVSKQWNSLIRIAGGDRFSRIYVLMGVGEKNAKNEDYMNFGIAQQPGFTPEDLYRKAEALYEAVASGERKVVMDTSDSPEGAAPSSSEY